MSSPCVGLIILLIMLFRVMQSGDIKAAKLLLKERKSAVPSDTHTFRRLSVVFNAEGNQHAAQGAAYTAYQLGLGQHGLASNEKSV